ncbi:MAG: deoxyhypusine synthase family protein [Candidatus Bathyarchaeota archaeon]
MKFDKEFFKDVVHHVKLKPKMYVDELIREMAGSGCFGAGRLAQAVDIYESMLKEKCLIVLGLAGAMVPGGMRNVITEMVKRKMVDVIVSTGANMVHDLLEVFGGRHYKGTTHVDDEMLYKHGVDRVYDVFIPEADFKEKFDKPLIEIFRDIAKYAKNKAYSTCELMREVGKRIVDENSIIYNAYKCNVPIFVPTLHDSCYGLAEYEYVKHYGERGIIVDAFKDVLEFLEIIEKNDSENGALLIGGGVPKNFIFQAAFKVNKPYKYVVQITTDRPEPGGLSGATLEEAVSWGKVEGKALKVQVIGDATICLPIIVAAVMERIFGK